ncbi:MAG: 1-deoxy-D-xylulose-5-phosphate synthase [Bacteroidetes bacterium ADurb.Bin397]|nr:MAG: 1-deoxy-D-xylulose-5-phosphate synthase [Bacteroidetes bacterium ADurb.Bin397]
MQRAFDQVVHDVALQNLHVVFCLDRGGLAGADGPTHHGVFDFAYFRCIPNMVVASPMNEEELRNMMFTASRHNGPFSIRYPRGNGVMVEWKTPLKEMKVGTGRLLREGEEIAILSVGHPGNFAEDACNQLAKEGFYPAHYDMRFVKPLDEEMLHEVFSKYKKVITVEDHAIQGGFGSAVSEFMTDHNYSIAMTRLGVPDRFIEHGEQKELYDECHFDAKAIMNAVRQLVGSEYLVHH